MLPEVCVTLHGVAGRDHVAREEYLRSHVDRVVIPSLCTVCATAIAPPSPPPLLRYLFRSSVTFRYVPEACQEVADEVFNGSVRVCVVLCCVRAVLFGFFPEIFSYGFSSGFFPWGMRATSP